MTITKKLYFEQKTDGCCQLDDRGPSFIADVSFSKSGKTIYCNNKTYVRLKKGGIYGNHYCEQDGNEYWISGVKTKGSNRLNRTSKIEKKEHKRKMNGGN